MTTFEERVLIYIALAAICSFVGVFAGLEGAVLSFLLIAVVIEGVYWFGMPRPRVSPHRLHRILFN